MDLRGVRCLLMELEVLGTYLTELCLQHSLYVCFVSVKVWCGKVKLITGAIEKAWEHSNKASEGPAALPWKHGVHGVFRAPAGYKAHWVREGLMVVISSEPL